MPHLLLISYILVLHCSPYILTCLSLLYDMKCCVIYAILSQVDHFSKFYSNLKPKVKFKFCFNVIYVHTD